MFGAMKFENLMEFKKEDDMSNKYHLPCQDCGSSDALSDYDDHTYCFACDTRRSASEEEEAVPSCFEDFKPTHITKRGLSLATCAKFNYGVTPSGDQVANYINPDNGRVVYQKIRQPDKSFYIIKGDEPRPDIGSLLWGRSLWGDSGGSKLLITEGEIDALSGYEALGPIGFHVVSIPNGASGALNTLKANLDWIDRYESIYLGFDNDEAGREATDKCAEALGLPNVHIMNLPLKVKDINELWLAEGRNGVLEAYQQASVYSPSGIITASDFRRILTEKPQRGYDFPWPTLNNTTYGIRPGLTIITAGSGVGKTTWFKQVEAHLYSLGLKLGIIHLEESSRDTLNSMLTLLDPDSRDFHTPDSTVSDAERLKAVARLEQDNRIVLYDKTQGFDEEAVMRSIRFMVKGLDADAILLDHLTALTDQYDRDVNQRTRNLIVKLGKMSVGMGFPLLMISHLRKANGQAHEEGGRVHLDDILGAGAIKQWAEHVFALERNNQAEDESKNFPMLRDLKNRPLGQHTGTLIPLEYDSNTFRLLERDTFPTNNGSPAQPLDF